MTKDELVKIKSNLDHAHEKLNPNHRETDITEDELAEINLNFDHAYKKLNPNNRDNVWNTALDISEIILKSELKLGEGADAILTALHILNIFVVTKAFRKGGHFDQMRANRADADNR